MKSSVVVLAVAGLLTISGTAHALSLITPYVFVNGSVFVACVATNGGKKPANIVITARNQAGGEVGARSLVCDDEVAPGATCYATFGENEDVSCTVDGPDKMRAHAELMEWNGAKLVGIIQATK